MNADTATIANKLTELDPSTIDSLIQVMGLVRAQSGLTEVQPVPEDPFALETAETRAYWDGISQRAEADTAQIAENIAAGRIYIHAGESNSSAVIHSVDCVSQRKELDRPAVWAQFEDRWRTDAHFNTNLQMSWVEPLLPTMVTLADIEDMPAYNACDRCDTSALAHRKKRRLFNVKPTSFHSLSRTHISRVFATLDGAVLGRAESITITADHTVLTFEDGATATGGKDDTLIMVPAKLEHEVIGQDA
ncbi:hypothetical protein [Leifsonia sp. Leaf264]|uniref:hypothetical protein n=1 Tax=Leifsonia sp. Leaf264 TaxID=1736314 RepID=UPI0006F37EF3|nr:hypothetical protein [Leifsonia sp. Leaf264]KQO98517.1 hypothetical protein ASF30_10675 [Leifsonia sp. Leaf264]